MKKYSYLNPYTLSGWIYQIPLRMKLSFITLFILAIQVSAVTFSQQDNLNVKVENTTVYDILKIIENDSDYRFFYNEDLKSLSERMSIDVTDADINVLLNQILKNSDLGYQILDNNVVVITLNSALQNVISGKVTDANTGEPLPGVNILIKGTGEGTVTDLDGEYTIIPENTESVLVFSFVGYISEEVVVGQQTKINIQLVPSLKALEEVVVIGYGTIKKEDLTGSVAQVSSEDINSTPVTSAAEALRGRVAGVDVTNSNSPGASPNIIIRGKSSFDDNGNNPLWVVDGIPINSYNIDLNPADIEKIDILKDASSTAIYGSRGSNGVIMVTTKHAKEGGPAVISYDGYFGIKEAANTIDFLNGADYAEYRREAHRAIGAPDDDQQIFDAVQLESIEQGRSTDWIDLVLGNTGYLNNHNLSLSRSGSKSRISSSVGYHKNQSIIKKADYQRVNFKLNTSVDLTKKLTVGLSSIFSHSLRNEVPKFVRHYTQLHTLGIPYDEEGNLLPITSPNETQITNPLFENENSDLETRAIRFLGNANAKYNFTEAFSYQVILGADIRSRRGGAFYGLDTRESRERGNVRISRVENSITSSYTFDHILNYKKQFGIHQLDVTGVFDYQKYNKEAYNFDVTGMDFDGLWYNMQAGTDWNDHESIFKEAELISYMGRANYTLLNRYLFTVTGRYDGASQLAEGNRWDFFPAAAFAWRISEESFMSGSEVVNNLKFRLGWGHTGNSGTDTYIYETLGLLGESYYNFDDEPGKGKVPTKLPNKGLKWERTKEVNLGLDWGLLDNRLYGSIDVYQGTVEDLLLRRELVPTSGYESSYENIGSVSNKGLEFIFTGTPISTPKINMHVTLNFSKNINEIIDLYGDKKDDPGNNRFIGHPIDAYYVFNYAGVWQTSEVEGGELHPDINAGDPKYQTDNENGVPDADDKIIIDSEPDWYGGMDLSFNVYDFDFSAYIYTRQGLMAYSEVHSALLQVDGRYITGVGPGEYWTMDNPSNLYPRPKRGGYGNLLSANYSSYTIKDLSFIRLGNISLGYSLKQSWLNQIKMDRLRIYVSVKNAFTWTAYDGWDPEDGTKRDSHPLLRSYLFGIQASF